MTAQKIFMAGAVSVIFWLGLSLSLVAQVAVELPTQSAIRSALAKVKPAIVQIETIGGRDSVGGTRVTNQPKTGLVVGRDGWVITASFNLAHEPTTIFVRAANEQRLPATVVSKDHSRKLTLLKIEPSRSLAEPELVGRNQLAVGQAAIAIGRSLDWQNPNVSVGIVSALRRIWDRAIQTDAGVSPHNFGGPLIDLNGRVMGVLVPMSPQGDEVSDGTEWYDSGIGFAVPLEPAALQQMLNGKSLWRGQLGVTFKETDGYASSPVIAACPGNSPAARSGLQVGDEIKQIDGVPTSLVNQVRHALGAHYAGEEVTISYLRDDEMMSAIATLAKDIEPWRHAMLGLLAQPAENGVRIRHVFPQGPAAIAGIQVDDRLVAINGKPIASQEALELELMNIAVDSVIAVSVLRGEQERLFELSVVALSAEKSDDVTRQAADASKLVPLTVAESPNLCHGYFPKSDRPSALLMWLGEPGERDPEATLTRWQAWCDATNTALLIPQSLNEKRWTRDEIEFLNKVTEQARQQYNIDSFRIAVGGQTTGGTMASLVAMSQRSTWRGLILINAPAATRVAQFQSEPKQRQMVLIVDAAAEEKIAQQMERWTKHFEDQMFPVTLLETDPSGIPEMVTQWLAQLARF